MFLLNTFLTPKKCSSKVSKHPCFVIIGRNAYSKYISGINWANVWSWSFFLPDSVGHSSERDPTSLDAPHSAPATDLLWNIRLRRADHLACRHHPELRSAERVAMNPLWLPSTYTVFISPNWYWNAKSTLDVKGLVRNRNAKKSHWFLFLLMTP